MAEKNLTDGTLALERKKPRVITIEATEKPKDIKLRVAAYARVSTSSEDQLNSFAAQNRYYTSLISGKENWTLVDVYADEGITGTSAAKREDFQRMLADCRRGLIDHILCKSISRFARNTTECLELTRELKSIGVSVCFEEQNIDTMKVSGKILTSLFAAFAQAESESISKNLRWSYQRRMQAGEFITCKAAYGYKLKDGTLEISEPEATVVRNIFSLYLSGSGLDQIADLLAKSGLPTGNGKKSGIVRRLPISSATKSILEIPCSRKNTVPGKFLIRKRSTKGNGPDTISRIPIPRSSTRIPSNRPTGYTESARLRFRALSM